ncbi:MAG TPA: GNAT family N-acetyltransferase [Jatrophihabitans sp.]|jgi:RimJ/RimL family protein N-acetyltransferase
MAQWNGLELDGLVLHSGRLTLRPWQPSDASRVAEIMAEDRMHAYLNLPRPYTAESAHQFVADYAPSGASGGGYLALALAENSSGRVVGAAGLNGLNGGPTTPEIGYWVATDSQGNGYATEATATLARFALSNGASRVQVRCDTLNLASAAVALAAGFRFEGVLRSGVVSSYGTADCAVFGRTASDNGEAVPRAWPILLALTDGVVTVRAMTAADWPTILATENNEEADRWAFSRGPMSDEEARANASRAALDWLVGAQARTVICDATTGAGAGTLLLRRSGPPEVLGIGYGVAPGFRGRGFTSRALTLVADWAFTQTGTARLELGCKRDNIASSRAAEKAGFIADGVFAGRLRNDDGSYSDELRYSRLRPGRPDLSDLSDLSQAR